MSLKGKWVDKVDGVDVNSADDINQVANAVINLEENAVMTEELNEKINDALQKAKESGEFNGEDGKSAYAYAQEGGYSGTEAEFTKILADIGNNGNDGLPTVTEADNGKVLQVVDGEWQPTELAVYNGEYEVVT